MTDLTPEERADMGIADQIVSDLQECKKGKADPKWSIRIALTAALKIAGISHHEKFLLEQLPMVEKATEILIDGRLKQEITERQPYDKNNK